MCVREHVSCRKLCRTSYSCSNMLEVDVENNVLSVASLQNVNGIKYHAKNGHRTQIRVRKPFKCRCGKSYKTSQGLRHHTINFHPPISTDIIRKMQQ